MVGIYEIQSPQECSITVGQFGALMCPPMVRLAVSIKQCVKLVT